MKAKVASEAVKLQHIPNIGPAMVEDFKVLGIARPAQLAGADPFALYRRLCRITGTRHDPCVLEPTSARCASCKASLHVPGGTTLQNVNIAIPIYRFSPQGER
jgi:hypothetical protein